MSESALTYHEIPEMPGVQRFACEKLKSTLSIESCADRWELANSAEPNPRMSACVKCPIGALHAGKSDLNLSPWKGSMACARCGWGSTRLITGHLCLSHYNRQREVIRGFNAKHTAPKMHPPLHRREVSFITGGKVRTKSIEHTTGLEEVLFSVLRTEIKAVKFGFRATTLHAQFDGDEFDCSIDVPSDILVTPEHVTGNAHVAAAPVPDEMGVELDAEPVTAEFDPYAPMREVINLLDRDAPACAPGMSRRAAKRMKQQQRRQVRVSSVTVGLLRNIGALPAPAPVIAPAWQPSSSYSASLMSIG